MIQDPSDDSASKEMINSLPECIHSSRKRKNFEITELKLFWRHREYTRQKQICHSLSVLQNCSCSFRPGLYQVSELEQEGWTQGGQTRTLFHRLTHAYNHTTWAFAEWTAVSALDYFHSLNPLVYLFFSNPLIILLFFSLFCFCHCIFSFLLAFFKVTPKVLYLWR